MKYEVKGLEQPKVIDPLYAKAGSLYTYDGDIHKCLRHDDGYLCFVVMSRDSISVFSCDEMGDLEELPKNVTITITT